MNKLNKKIKSYFSSKNTNLEYILNTSDQVGEGEHKIYEYIRKNNDYHKTTSTVIYGLDADLIMLTLNHLPYSDQLYLFRDPYFIKNIDDTLEENSNYLIDIPEFSEKLICEMIDIKIVMI